MTVINFSAIIQASTVLVAFVPPLLQLILKYIVVSSQANKLAWLFVPSVILFLITIGFAAESSQYTVYFFWISLVLLAIGIGGAVYTLQLYSKTVEELKNIPPLRPQEVLNSLVVDGKIYIFREGKVKVYNPQTNTWSEAASIP
ncbi:MAG: hypothetical protein M1556_01350 [Candidatus Thermoplasmatota archaeon]|nr:hypothetical protein [Candidatus Thermoplasmatota archaeon]MCL6002281.1 hypothetical protein [Candidatus Thermoplasmatota archaeon]